MHSVLPTASHDDTIRGALAVGSMPTAPNGSVAVADAVRAIGQLDLSKLRAAGVPLTAAFDYDDTLAEGDVFLPAMRALAAKGHFTPAGDPALRTALAGAGVANELIERGDVNDRAALLTNLVVPSGTPVPVPGAKPISVGDAFYIFGDAMRGMNVAQATESMRTAFEHGVPEAGIEPLKSHLFNGPAPTGDSARDLVDGTRAAGLDPWIVTWGFDFIAKAAAPYVGIGADHVIGHGMHVQDGAYAGLVDASGRPKWQMIRDALRVPPIVSFGNSSSDLPMLDATAGPTFLVKPVSPAMRDAVAQRAGRTFGLHFDAAPSGEDARLLA